MDAELSREIRALAMRMANYRFAQGQARERGENDKADEYAEEADKAWRELCKKTEPTDGVLGTDADRRDATRYRYLRQPGRTTYVHWIDNDGTPEELDAAVDAAAGVTATSSPKLDPEARHTTQCKHWDNNCGAVHPSNCPDCPFRNAGVMEAQAPLRWLYDWTHSSALGKPDEHFTGFTTDEAHARKHDNVRPVYARPVAPERDRRLIRTAWELAGASGWIDENTIARIIALAHGVKEVDRG